MSIGTMICVSLCVACRRWPGPWVGWAARAISVVLVADAVSFVSVALAEGRWSVQVSLPLALCDVALIVAAIACWWPRWLLAVELAYFWGLAGTLQAVVTPDLSAGFPQLEFFMFAVGHLGIVIAALFLVVGLRLKPRRGSWMRVFAITVPLTVPWRAQAGADGVSAHWAGAASGRKVGQHKNRIPNMISISESPAEAADRAVPGHWERQHGVPPRRFRVGQ